MTLRLDGGKVDTVSYSIHQVPISLKTQHLEVVMFEVNAILNCASPLQQQRCYRLQRDAEVRATQVTRTPSSTRPSSPITILFCVPILLSIEV